MQPDHARGLRASFGGNPGTARESPPFPVLPAFVRRTGNDGLKETIRLSSVRNQAGATSGVTDRFASSAAPEDSSRIRWTASRGFPRSRPERFELRGLARRTGPGVGGRKCGELDRPAGVG